MMRFLRKGDRYVLNKPLNKRCFLPFSSFQYLLLSLSAYYYQFSCNVQESRASGATGYRKETGISVIKERLLRLTRSDGKKSSDGMISAAVLLTIFCVLFSFASVVEAQAQEPRQGGAPTKNTKLDIVTSRPDRVLGIHAKNEEYIVKLSYKYVIDEQAYAYRLARNSSLTVKNYPLIHYDIDYATTPNIKLGEFMPAFFNNLAFRFVDEDGNVQVGSLFDVSKDKLVVLDFWATWCVPCVISRNHWEEIKAELGRDIEVLAIMLDHDYKALQFGTDKKWQSPIVFGPEAYIINSMFFQRPVVSRMAWIKDGKLIAFTGTKDYDLQLVKDVLAGKDVEIPMNLDYTYTSDKS